MAIKIEIHADAVKEALREAAERGLELASAEIESAAVRTTPTDTGQLRGSWGREFVDDLTVKIGNTQENAIWNEYGTGEYALDGKGSPTPWFVPVEKVTGKSKPTYQGKVVVVYGKNGQQFYKTDGKKPQRTLEKAFASKQTAAIKLIENEIKSAMK